MSYQNLFAYLDLDTDFRGIKIDQLRWAVEPDGTEVLLCTEFEPDFHIIREVLNLSLEELPVINIPFYRLDYIKHYYPELTEDQPVQDMPEMEFDLDAKNHIINKAVSVIPFKEDWVAGTPDQWCCTLNRLSMYGDFSHMFFAKDAEKHFNGEYKCDEEEKKHLIKLTLDFADHFPNKITVVFCGIC